MFCCVLFYILILTMILQLRMIEANQRRDTTDSASITEVKNLRSTISDLKRKIDELNNEVHQNAHIHA